MWWIAAALTVGVGIAIAGRYVHRFQVDEGHVGLLYRKGPFVQTLHAGVYWRFGTGMRVEQLDMRLQELTVPGQELLTGDNVSLKVSLSAEYRVVEPERTIRETASWLEHVYRRLQVNLRDAVAKRTFDEVLQNRGTIGAELCEQTAADANAVGVELKSVAVRDVMLSADLRRAFAEAVRLREEGKAVLEKARSETAALRCLANASRMLKNNPELLNMRILQSVETVASSAGNTVHLGAPYGLPDLVLSKARQTDEQ